MNKCFACGQEDPGFKLDKSGVTCLKCNSVGTILNADQAYDIINQAVLERILEIRKLDVDHETGEVYASSYFLACPDPYDDLDDLSGFNMSDEQGEW